ncbi:hypothetical protein NQZ68_031842 [Dissostichus eleginoides]|nr:hypothetical protein NQZ68_031842 [Dissostichus eleginoides]
MIQNKEKGLVLKEELELIQELMDVAPGVGALIVNDTKAAAYAIGSDTEQFDGSDWGVGMTVIRQLSGGKKPC